MKRALWLLLAVTGLFASMAAMSTSAFGLALPENLPVSAKTRTWTGKATSATTELKSGGTTVKCSAATAEGTEEPGKPLGEYHIKFKGCESSGFACTGPGDAAKEILALGTWHLVWDEKGAKFEKLTTAVLFLISPTVKFTCAGFIAAEVKGEVLCLHKEPTKKSTTHEFSCGGAENKEDNWCKEDKEGKCEGLTKPKLLTSINGGKETESEQVGSGSTTYTEEIFADV